MPSQIGWDEMLPFALFQLFFNVPFFVLFVFVYEKIVYGIMKLTGGIGTFPQQFHVSVLVALAMAIASSLGLITPLPCLDVIAAVGLLVLTIYFS